MTRVGQAHHDEQPTIVGVATGTPDGGLAVVRLSGSAAFEIARRCIRGSLPAARKLGRRGIVAPCLADLAGDEGTGPAAAAEDGLVVCMPGPSSFTGEDVVELHIHAGRRNVDQVVGWLIEAGARAAGAGEFTRRAFEHGRLSLDQAEGIAALIGARTEAALNHARRLVAGELREEVEALRTELMALRLDVEGALGFPEELGEGECQAWSRRCDALADRVRSWLERFETGRRARAVPRVVLSGPPNAGKSALFNALLGRDRALVSGVAGTTRDYLEAELSLGDRCVVLVDTAGLREASGVLEAAGVARAREQLEGADVVVLVVGADQPGDAALWGVAAPPGAALLEVESKRDLGESRGDWMGVSSVTSAGVEGLRQRLGALLTRESEEGWIGLARHRDRGEEAHEALREAALELSRGEDRLELAALSLLVAWSRLGEIVGSHQLGAVGEELLAEIFSRFCIGK